MKKVSLASASVLAATSSASAADGFFDLTTDYNCSADLKPDRETFEDFISIYGDSEPMTEE